MPHIIHSKYIKDMKQKTGRSIRELEAEWDKAEREIREDQLFDPDKYQNLSVTDGTMAQVISAQFEKNVIEPEVETTEEVNEEMTDIAEHEFEDELQEEFDETDPALGEEPPSDEISLEDDESLEEDLDQIEGEIDESINSEDDTENADEDLTDIDSELTEELDSEN